MLRLHTPSGRLHPHALRLQRLGLLIYLHFLRHCRQEFQRMKPCLVLKPHHPRNGKGQLAVCPEGSLDPQGFRSLRLPPQKRFLCPGIQTGRTPQEITIYFLFPNQPLIFPYGAFICPGILPRHLMAKGPDQPVIEQIVLRGDLCRGIAGLSASDSICLQDHSPDPRLLQIISRQNPRQSCPDDHHRNPHLSRKRLSLSDFHICPPD